ncbi:hypothetical protein FM020_06480 [Acinetobacter tandoii]|nr:hypothetical protein FM020_06480 [Acinetobacter tandoii]
MRCLIYERVAFEESFVQKRLAETYGLRGISGSKAIYSLLFIEHGADFGQVEEWIALQYVLLIVIELIVTARSNPKEIETKLFILYLSGHDAWGFFFEHPFQMPFL